MRGRFENPADLIADERAKVFRGAGWIAQSILRIRLRPAPLDWIASVDATASRRAMRRGLHTAVVRYCYNRSLTKTKPQSAKLLHTATLK
jgi:hypothetical protein